MSKKKIPKSSTRIIVAYKVPTFLVTSTCPHCEHFLIDEFDGRPKKPLLHCCSNCGKDYILNFKKKK